MENLGLHSGQIENNTLSQEAPTSARLPRVRLRFGSADVTNAQHHEKHQGLPFLVTIVTQAASLHLPHAEFALAVAMAFSNARSHARSFRPVPVATAIFTEH